MHISADIYVKRNTEWCASQVGLARGAYLLFLSSGRYGGIMMELAQAAELVDTALQHMKREIFALGETLGAIPESGFAEVRTMETLAERFRALGLSPETELAVTGVRASAGPADAPEIILLADMDALPTRGVPGEMMHSCGHHAQMTVMCAVFEALLAAGVPDRLGFRVSFVGAPAEEYTHIDYRKALRREGKIRYLSGKQELIRLGVFDRAACVIKYHSMADRPDRMATINGTLNGFLAKQVLFIGKAAHAGAAPHEGINALNAASIALMAIHSQRETFRDEDHIRVHPVLKEGGTTVNTVPDRAFLETYVRGASVPAIRAAAGKVDRAVAAGAMAVGAQVTISTTPGYLPFNPCPALGAMLEESASRFLPARAMELHDHSYASDDIGDVASLVPACQLGFSGFSGTIHGADFTVCDPERAYMLPARILADLTLRLGANHGARAREIQEAFIPTMKKEEYLAFLDECFEEKTYRFD